MHSPDRLPVAEAAEAAEAPAATAVAAAVVEGVAPEDKAGDKRTAAAQDQDRGPGDGQGLDDESLFGAVLVLCLVMVLTSELSFVVVSSRRR